MVAYGKQVVLSLCSKHPEWVSTLYLAKEVDKKLFDRLKKAGKPILRMDPKKAQAMARGGNHQGFLAEYEAPGFVEFEPLKQEATRLLVLCGVTDIGNVGALVRSGYCLGVGGVILSGVAQMPYEALVRTSSGAALELPLSLYPSSLDLANELQQVGFALVGADSAGVDVRQCSFPEKMALFLGSEGEGLPQKLLQKMQQKVAVVMDRPFDSLNVGVAGAILMDRIRDGRSITTT